MTPPTRVLGRTGLPVSPIGLGLAALGRPAYVNLGHGNDLGPDHTPHALEARAHAVLDAAWVAGIRYVDTARSYGRAEAFLASWLRDRDLAPGALTVGSKWGYTYTAGWRVDAHVHEVKDHSLAALRRQVHESRALLGDHLALYQIHSATPESGILDDGDVLDELARLRDGGLAVGLSTSGPDQGSVIRQALTIERGGSALFATVQATWNLLERSAGPALAEAHDAGLGVIVKEALANGRLAAPAAPVPAALALAAALAQPWADVVLSGAVTVGQLAANLDALTVTWDEEAAAGLDTVVEPPAAYWAARRALPWN